MVACTEWGNQCSNHILHMQNYLSQSHNKGENMNRTMFCEIVLLVKVTIACAIVECWPLYTQTKSCDREN